MQFKQFLFGVAGAALACGAMPASAAIVFDSITYSPESRFGGFNLTPAISTNTGSTGRFAASGTDLATNSRVSFLSYCIDIATGFASYNNYEVRSLSTVISDTIKRQQLAALILNADPLISTAASMTEAEEIAAAIGLAIWEIIYEDRTIGYDVSDGAGAFSVWGDFVPLTTRTNSYLTNVTTGEWTGDASRLSALVSVDGTSQNQVFILSPVPEPSTWAQLTFGLAIVGTAIRRRRRKFALA
jgi:hypothetical protein